MSETQIWFKSWAWRSRAPKAENSSPILWWRTHLCSNKLTQTQTSQNKEQAHWRTKSRTSYQFKKSCEFWASQPFNSRRTPWIHANHCFQSCACTWHRATLQVLFWMCGILRLSDIVAQVCCALWEVVSRLTVCCVSPSHFLGQEWNQGYYQPSSAWGRPVYKCIASKTKKTYVLSRSSIGMIAIREQELKAK